MIERRVVRETAKCYGCRHQLRIGEHFFTYRERANTNWEAMHAGTMYPKRFVCPACAAKRGVVAFPQPVAP